MAASLRGARDLAWQLARSPRQARHLRRWLRARGASPLERRLPWLAFDMIDLLDAAVTRASTVFEYGGGGSTLWFADRAGAVVTVEHDPEWGQSLLAATAGDERLTVLLRPATDQYAAYVSAIDEYPDKHFDVVVVDGRERVRCVAAAVSKVRPGGLLLLDDSDRPRYAQAHRAMSGWPARTITGLAPFKPMAGTTTVWRKPL